jgi:uncharacterized protein YjbJ (UPF0337 family)
MASLSLQGTAISHFYPVPVTTSYASALLQTRITKTIKEITMTNENQNTNAPAKVDKFAAFNAKIKETYSKLSDDDVKLYDGKRDQFFTKLKEKQNVSKEDGEKQIKEIEQACDAACSSEKSGNTKAA